MEDKLSSIIYSQFGLFGLILLLVAGLLISIYMVHRKLMVESVHQLNRDLITKRIESYAKLWSKMEPLAIYDGNNFDAGASKALYAELSKWYFSESGGLFLTSRTRELYFTLQNFLVAISDLEDWICLKRPKDPKVMFISLLASEKLTNGARSQIADIINNGNLEAIDTQEWNSTIEAVLNHLVSQVKSNEDHIGDLIFASAQQISSILRTNLTFEVRSRLNTNWPDV